VRFRRSLLLFLAILGPGLISALAGNDAGGVATYAQAGAAYGYSLLWSLVLIMFALAFVQEMCARMGAVTGKGLGELIREEYGVRWTMLALAIMAVANLVTTMAEFSGIAAGMQLFGVSKYLSVPIAGLCVWLIVVLWSFRRIEKFFLALCAVFVTYIFAGFMARPDWGEVLRGSLIPTVELSSGQVLLLLAVIGTSITPWMQFFVQSTIVDKGIKIGEYRYQRYDVIFGAVAMTVFAFFIVVATAAVLHGKVAWITTAQQAALALRPAAGRAAELLFTVGLANASLLAAAVLPVATAYAFCEAFGWEMGLSKRFGQARGFFGIFTFCLVVGMAVALIPKLPLIHMMVLSQNINGILLPVVLIFILGLVNNKRVMGDMTNSGAANIIGWATVVCVVAATVAFGVLSAASI
jgi:NRAMP (natural resistance-associated macrophage protein)-like metal ion transporter